jgi:MauM/NapG family ferredoxin protein
MSALGLASLAFIKRRAHGWLLRPPGALAEPDFLARCIRCFRCAEVCPPKAIVFESTLDISTSDTPFIEARESACTLCMKCTDICPTGALTRIAPDPKEIARRVRMGEPVLDENRCLAWSRTGVCRLCYFVCPYADRAITVGGRMLAPTFHASECVGCGLCEEACPSEVHAIRIRPTSLTKIGGGA